jgi:hypothetical protein
MTYHDYSEKSLTLPIVGKNMGKLKLSHTLGSYGMAVSLKVEQTSSTYDPVISLTHIGIYPKE